MINQAIYHEASTWLKIDVLLYVIDVNFEDTCKGFLEVAKVSSLEELLVNAYFQHQQSVPWFKVVVSVIDSEGPEAYRNSNESTESYQFPAEFVHYIVSGSSLVVAGVEEAVHQTVSVIFEDPGVQELLVKLYQKGEDFTIINLLFEVFMVLVIIPDVPEA
ncbi:hypothetical protein CK203_087020 [Vitis vinifera]|uniref:Uncharacterized protein n=1 Tax=Vitis vinifera TaxID=29760 RepID=A0A438CLW0_VITVI|nr:hypothetical protein CK203_087020 [Vitis vinifera]